MSLLTRPIRKAAVWNEQRVGAAKGIRYAMRYVFPDHWSFLLGEIALYSFMILIATGVYLALFYTASDSQVIYHGPYAVLAGDHMSEAFESVLNISFTVPAGLLFRQVHHWAADVFIAAIVIHLMRIFFTGAYRKPRDLNWMIGLTMLGLAILEGFAGYSLVDDLMSGMGLAIAYGVALSIPFIGGQVATTIWGGQFPGSSSFLGRLEIVHVFIIPLTLFALISVHLALIVRAHHTQFPGRGKRERNVVGTPLWPAYALRSIGLLLAVAGILFVIGGVFQINPIWQWGPFEPYLSTNGAQPDWYIGWLIGALRLMPNFEPVISGHTLVANPFWGGLFFPTLVFGVMFAYPPLERWATGDREAHNLLVRPRDRPNRTALGAAFLAWVVIIFAVGSTDRLFFRLHFSYTAQIHFWRVGVWVLPVLVFFIVRAACRSLASKESRPLREWQGTVLRRGTDGGFEFVSANGSATPVESAATKKSLNAGSGEPQTGSDSSWELEPHSS